jgi:hypothetical protein
MMRNCSSRPPSALNRSPKWCGGPDMAASPVEPHVLCADNISYHTVSYSYNVSATIKGLFSLDYFSTYSLIVLPYVPLAYNVVLFAINVDIKKIEPLPIP